MIRISLILLSILSSCFKDETVSGQIKDNVDWVLATLNETPVPTHITIAFPKEGKITGQAPCNRYFGNQTLPLPWFEITALGATKMACSDLNLETQYFGLLKKMTTAEITGDTLVLRSDTGDVLVYKNN